MTAEYRSQGDVARWCGVKRAAVSNWMSRWPDDTPEPDVIIRSENSGTVTRGWLPERRQEWEKFAAERFHGPHIASGASARVQSTAALIEEGVQTGRIDPQEAVKLLRELIGRKQ